MLDPILCPHELDDAPELAVLALLEVTLRTAVSVLLCAHPDLDDSDHPYWVQRPFHEQVAQRIVTRAGPLANLVRNYRAALLVAKTPPLPASELTDRPPAAPAI